MHTYSAITNDGYQIHLSMVAVDQCYILVYDIYTQTVNMKFFTDQQSALSFIRSLD